MIKQIKEKLLGLEVITHLRNPLGLKKHNLKTICYRVCYILPGSESEYPILISFQGLSWSLEVGLSRTLPISILHFQERPEMIVLFSLGYGTQQWKN